ncbi:putative bifunctional diguanylate cyclase/phosphodiesterase [Aliivibrio finisterrensis]|uniref:EAL domain-containing protein n=1 Tax=Aliivibrio finisterrensis TaxID=511998 RepID=A0A6N6RWB5_9GAMM|nr:GGDEF domain-containing phosphodiesterase [Aliivibrio finisterrensis]KAB2826035.1 EAL domain-containing protein [Aliivibrio finisterrensis]
MESGIILKLLLFCNLISFVFLSSKIFEFIIDNVYLKRIVTILGVFFYSFVYVYIESFILESWVNSYNYFEVITIVTLLTQVLFIFILFKSKSDNIKSNLENKSKELIYRDIISDRIKEKKDFNITKIKIKNHTSIIEYSSYKTFKILLSYASLLVKKYRNNRNVPIFYDGNQIIIIGNYIDKGKIDSFALGIYELLIKPIKIKNRNYILQPIIGNVIYSNDITDADEILKRADIACYKAKKLGLVIDYYSDNFARSINDEVDILSKLVYAIPSKEFELYYQPIVNSIDKTLHGYEALIRWPQKDGSMIPPDKFILIAEKNHYIKEITQWVVSQAAIDIRTFRDHNLNYQVHINISSLDLYDNDLYNQLFNMVTNKQLEPSSMILEITESALMSDVDAAYLILSKLSELGFYISIDDFGTGYSSLSLLRVLAFNQIKIDQSFIRNMLVGNSDYAIVASTIYLAHNLGCTVVAEGIEDEQLLIELQQLSCDYVQGYYINKPQPINEIINWSLKHSVME